MTATAQNSGPFAKRIVPIGSPAFFRFDFVA
jgi:hypothetical protein